MDNRRQQPRQPVAWPVRLWLSEHSFVVGRAVEASPQGARLYLNWLPAGGLRLEAIYRLDVQHPETAQMIVCAAEIRHLERKEVGVRLRQAFGLRVQSREAFPLELLGPDHALGDGGLATHATFSAPDRRVLARIVVVDDDDTDRELLTNALIAHGYRVAHACTGAEALAVVGSEHPDIVLLDMGLPDLDGLVVLQSVRRDNRRIGVITVTETEDLTVAFDCIHDGALDCLFKPVHPYLLGRAVARALATVRTTAVGTSVVT